MKRLALTILIIAATITSSNAQYISIQYSRFGDEVNNYNSELKSLQNFEDQLDQFSYSMMVNDIWLARKNKKAIIRTMEKEIGRTEREIEQHSWNGNSYSRRSNQRQTRSRSSGVYSKRNGYNGDFELKLLFEQLREQKRIKYNFESTSLISSRRRFLVNKKHHRKLMYQYRDLMKSSLEDSRRNNRERRG